MGLSNEERLTKMMWAVHHLTIMGRELQVLGADEIPYSLREVVQKTLPDLTGRLWHALLGNNTNGAFWILGGEFNNPVGKASGPWSVAIIEHCQQVHGEEWPRSKEFDPFNGFLDLSGLLEGYRKKIYLLYGHTEQLSYALRRYDDEMTAQYEGLNRLISDLQGTCFAVFQGDDGFAKAYAGNRLCEALYADKDVRKVFLALNLHHDLGPRLQSCALSDILAWDRWRLEHRASRQNTIVLALRICGPKFKYEHNLKKLIAATRGKGVRESVLRREFAKCLKAEEASTKEVRNQYYEDAEMHAAIAIHGFDIYDAMKKRLAEESDED